MFFRFLDDQPLPRLQAPSRGVGPSAMVLLEAPSWRETPTEDRGFAALCDTGEVRITRSVATAATVEADTVEVALMVVSAAMPARDTTGPGTNLHFPGAPDALARHAAHLFVGARCGGGFDEQRRAAMAVSTVAGAFGGLGVYWPEAGAIAAPGRLSTVAEDARAARWPVDVWMGATLFGGPGPGGDAVGALSRGAERFFGYEVAIAPRAGVDPHGQVRLLYAVASWLMTAGPMLRDGESLGPVGPAAAHTLVARLRKRAGGAADVMEFHRTPLQ